MGVSTNLDLSRIYRSPVFRSRSMVESHQELSRTLTDHQLRWGRGDVSTALYMRQLNRISVMILTYGAEVEVIPEAFSNFTLVQMLLRGKADIECDGIDLQLAQGEVAVISPRKNIRLLWQPGCEQLILKIPNTLLKQMACMTCAQSHCPPDLAQCDSWQDPAFKLDNRLVDQWNALVQQLLMLLSPENQRMFHPAWINQLEQTAALFLHAHQPSVLERDNRPGDGDAAERPHSGDADRLKLALLDNYMRKRLFAPISLEDLAKAAGVSARTLNILCHRHHGVAPMILLRNIRLEAARHRLRSDPNASVTEVALDCGFAHLGRFSAYYRMRFGELPRDTAPHHH